RKNRRRPRDDHRLERGKDGQRHSNGESSAGRVDRRNPASSTLTVGQTAQLTATPKDANGDPLTGRVITWMSDNATVAAVDGSGLVTAKGAGGPATITATSEAKSGTASITVIPVPVASVTVSPSTATVVM